MCILVGSATFCLLAGTCVYRGQDIIPMATYSGSEQWNLPAVVSRAETAEEEEGPKNRTTRVLDEGANFYAFFACSTHTTLGCFVCICVAACFCDCTKGECVLERRRAGIAGGAFTR